jgi:ABC-type glycerol-3-phosphate transport system substrate-binding protein
MKRLKEVITIKRALISIIVLGAILWISISGRSDISYIAINAEAVEDGGYDDTVYSNVSSSFTMIDTEEEVVVTPSDITVNTIDGNNYGLDQDILLMNETDVVTFSITAPKAGAYEIYINQKDISENILPNEISVKVNNLFQYEEAEVIELPTYWVFETETFQLDRYGNEILPNSVKSENWNTTALYDDTGLNQAPLLFDLNQGTNQITIEVLSGKVVFGDIVFKTPKQLPTYETYVSNFTAGNNSGTIMVGAEDLAAKTNPSIRLDSERDPSATAYDTKYLRLNSLDGYSYRSGNDQIIYEMEVEESGFYNLAFKYKQNYVLDMPVFREITVNGEIPFEEFRMYPFAYTNEYENLILNNGEENLQVYLEAGTNEIGLRVVVEPYRNSYQNVIGIMNEITDLSLEIKKLTGNTVDRYRTWKLIDFIPDVEDRMDRWIVDLYEINEDLKTYTSDDKPGQLTNLVLAIEQLEELREDVDDIPNKMVMLADGDSSTSQLLGTVVQTFIENGLDFERIYLTTGEDLPRPEANIFVRTVESTKRFFLSFTDNDYAVSDVDEGVIEVWVNHPRQYIEIMQTIIDNDFTSKTGIEVKLSIMPDENKLILANSANIAPDVALGVNHWIPYEFAIRGASLDLRQFDGYEETIENFSPGVMIPYAFEEGIFGLPETQNFWVTFYREDILNSLNIPVPDTWEEVLEILPELQRFGMNYYEPLAFFKGFKPFVATMPFIYQFDGTLYADDGMSTLINSEETLEGIELMTDLFTVYNMPKEVLSFYNDFRYGTLPIGISDLSTYLQLTIAAPELAGKWDIAPHPGVLKENGEVERWAASGAQASMILADTEYPQQSWDFLSWFMSTKTQTDFALRLQTTYGTEYLWNTANLEAFANLPLPTRHKQVILDQWEYALEASRIPGAYMVERELSNAWNSIVFDDANPRITLDEAVKTANREILYKMEEFDYVMNGEIVRSYRVPTIYNIDYWLKGRDEDE